MSGPEVFRVGVTRDIRCEDGSCTLGDIGLGMLESSVGVEWAFLDEDVAELTPDLVERFDAVIVWGPSISARTVEAADRLTLVARLGVGFDAVDVEALTKRGIALAITPDGVRRPIASGALTFLLALSHKLLIKDRLTREGRWDEAYDHIGVGLAGRTLGVIGAGNIGSELLGLVRPFGMRHLVADPYASAEAVAALAAELVDLETLLTQADFICITCPLTPETHHLVSRDRLALMKRSAYLINVARGGIVDQAALTQALAEGKLAGAGLDVFEQEPLPVDDPLLSLPNVVLAPHAIGGTDENYRLMGQSACQAALAISAGDQPKHIVNRPVFENPLFQSKLRRHAQRKGASA
jgi:D-3-phosphoglycerate dehydrogenase